MRILRDISSVARAAGALMCGGRVPVIVSWNITYRCNLDCGYCGLHRPDAPEASTREVVERVAALARLGARCVGFSGGEPLLRSDLAEVVAACRDHGMRVSVQTNGFYLRRRLPSLPGVNEVRVSLDGPREVQESVRGAGSYDAALDAILACREHGVPVLATAVMTGPSLARVREFLDLAGGLGVGILFQPLDERFTGSRNTEAALRPPPEAFRAAVDFLIAEKTRGSGAVANSLPGLRYLRGWPDPDPIPCRASRLMCTVDADGQVFVCDMYPGYERNRVRPGDDLAATLNRLDLPAPCPRCITGAMTDLNLAAGGRLQAVPALLGRLWSLRP